jgi:hypothetical protein
LFGCDRDRPFARIDRQGLCWLIAGNRLVDLSENAAIIETWTGARQTWWRKSSDIGRVLALGWLLEPGHGDKGALARALFGLIQRAIAMRVSPTTGREEGKVCFFCTLKPSTIATLVDLG